MVRRSDLVKLPVVRKMVKVIPKEIMIGGEKRFVEVEKVVKETRYGEYFIIQAIVKIEPHLNEKKRMASKTRCEILYDVDKVRYVIAKPQEEIAQLINGNKKSRIGFKYKNRI